MDFKIQKELTLREQIFDARYHHSSQNDLIVAVTLSGNVHLIRDNVLQDKISKLHKGSSIRRVRFNSDGHMVTIAKTIKLYDLEARQTIHTITRDEQKSSSFYSVHPMGNGIICAGDDDGCVYMWDIRSSMKPVFTSRDCDQYISDIDGKYEGRRLMVCTSGEGTLTAYDLRAKKKIEPQSELFEAGFQCVKLFEPNRKVVIGGEDGAIYVFNQNEWGHTSGKFAIGGDLHNRGKCSIDCMDVLPDNTTFLAGCSDGTMRSFTLWPHLILNEKTFCKKSSLESIHVNPDSSKRNLVVAGENQINIVCYEDKSGDESENDDSHAEKTPADISETIDANLPHEPATKKIKPDTDDYLQIFS